METILIIEDDRDIRGGIRILLEREGYSVLEAEDGLHGLDLVAREPDLVILDVMMPGISGIQTCREIREISNVPVLFLTARVREKDKLAGLAAGGDDYLTKPFSYGELLGRVKALLRRYHVYRGKNETSYDVERNEIELCGLTVCLDYNKVAVDGRRVELTDIEYRILKLLIQQPDRVFSAQSIYETVWNEPYFYTSNGTVMVHIRKLRVKIEKDPQNPELIRTVWGRGYRFGYDAE